MKAENNQMFTEVSSEEAVTINGGSVISRYINSVVAASGAWRYVPYARRAVGNGQRLAYQRGGTTGQLNYLLGMANRLTLF
jgi:hypothetical protein